MKKEYDFSKGKRGRVVKRDPNKVRITIRLDADIVEHFKKIVVDAGGGNYQTLINQILRDHITTNASHPITEQRLRTILREELRSI
jgi:uncharacterized protein (DUF4415 family)